MAQQIKAKTAPIQTEQNIILGARPVTIALAVHHYLFRAGLSLLVHSFERCTVVLEAGNGQELIDKLGSTASAPDICILDLSMPVLNGYSTLSLIRKKWPAQKVIVLSAVSEPYVMLQMMKAGANAFLLKNVHQTELQHAILQVYEEGRYSSALFPPKMPATQNQAMPAISKRQLEFLSLCGSDMNYGEIARTMGVSKRAIESLHQRLSDKLHITSRAGLATFAIKIGLIVLEDLINTSILESITMM